MNLVGTLSNHSLSVRQCRRVQPGGAVGEAAVHCLWIECHPHPRPHPPNSLFVNMFTFYDNYTHATLVWHVLALSPPQLSQSGLDRIELDQDPCPAPPHPPAPTSMVCLRHPACCVVPPFPLLGSDDWTLLNWIQRAHWQRLTAHLPSWVTSWGFLFVCPPQFKMAVSKHCCSTLLFPLNAKNCWSWPRTGTVALDWFTCLITFIMYPYSSSPCSLFIVHVDAKLCLRELEFKKKMLNVFCWVLSFFLPGSVMILSPCLVSTCFLHQRTGQDVRSLISVSFFFFSHAFFFLSFLFLNKTSLGRVAYVTLQTVLYYVLRRDLFQIKSMTPSSINDCWNKWWLSGMFNKS